MERGIQNSGISPQVLRGDDEDTERGRMTTTPFTPCRFKVGDKVSIMNTNDVSIYACDVIPASIGPIAEVTSITRGVCESGWMVTVKNERVSITLDQNWLKEL